MSMTTRPFPNLRRFAALLLTLLCAAARLAPRANAADVEVTASLSDTATDAGQPVEYQITVTGARSVRPPQSIAVEGLDIRYAGQSTQLQMNNFNVTTSVVHSYTVTPERAGRFVIPPQPVEVGGRKYMTPAVTLTVGGSSAGAGSSGGGGGSGPADSGNGSGTGAKYFAELVLPKQTAYVGEAIPVEVRIYVDTSVRWQLEQLPVIAGEGFTVQKLTKPTQNEVRRDGMVYDLMTFKTAITPAKSGTLTLGPATVECTAILPQPRRARPRGLFNDPFDDDFFNNPLFGMRQRLSIKTDPVELNVKPLPAAGQPADFSGAVGQFTLSATAKPAKVQIGDPVTITAKISGRGNFDRAGAPTVVDESGWRSYPAAGKFTPDDDVGISGAKTFDIAAIPTERKTALPALRWSYFDPIAEKYVTLTAGRMPITVEGQPAAAPSQPPVAQNSGSSSGAAAQPGATPAPSDILYIRTDPARWGESFEPNYRQRGFWLAQLAPLGALLAFIGFGVRRIRLGDVRARKLAEWRREKADAMRTARRGGASDAEFLEAAVRCVQLETAAQTGRDPATLDAPDAAALPGVNAETRSRLEALFSARAELRYAGAGGGGPALSRERRAEILETINRLEQNHARA